MTGTILLVEDIDDDFIAIIRVFKKLTLPGSALQQ